MFSGMLKVTDMKNTKNAENPFILSLQIPSNEIFPQKENRLWHFFKLSVRNSSVQGELESAHMWSHHSVTLSIGW